VKPGLGAILLEWLLTQ